MSLLSKLMFWRTDAPRVSVLRLSGVIASGGSPLRKNLNYDSLEPVIKKAFLDKKQSAVILCINSPGGSPVQSALIGKRLRQLADKNKIPIIAFVRMLLPLVGIGLLLVQMKSMQMNPQLLVLLV